MEIRRVLNDNNNTRQEIEIDGGKDGSVVVSILCATYNHENYIAMALEGFVKQKTDFRFEAIVHDDASTDKTAEIIRKYASEYPDIIRPVYQKENQYSKGRKIINNFLFPLATGKYIAICEGDDYWTDPFKLQKQVDFMRKHPECSVSYHAAELFDVRLNRKTGVIRTFKKTCVLPPNKLFFIVGEVAPTASVLFLRKYMLNPPDFYFDAPVGDLPSALILSYHGRVGYIDEVMAVRNIWVANSWTTKFNECENTGRKISHLKAVINLLNRYNIYSKKKFDIQIKKVILQYETEILRLQGKQPFQEKEFLDLLQSFGILDRFKIKLSFKMPKLIAMVKKVIS